VEYDRVLLDNIECFSTMLDMITGRSLQSELESKLPSEGRWIEHQSFTKSDIPPVLYEEEKGHGTPEKWTKYRAKKLGENYCGSEKTDLGEEAEAEGNTIYIYRNTEQRIYHSVLKGEVRCSNGLRVSENQFYGKKPKYTERYGEYHAGLVVKMSGDYTPSLSPYHNQSMEISEVIDAYHYSMKTELENELMIRDTDVKSWICPESEEYNVPV
jgi:hypothetical protein